MSQVPIDPQGCERANDAWRRMQNAYVALTDAEDIHAAEDAWQDFLTHFNRIFAKLGAATKGYPAATAVWERIIAERNADELLTYLRKARNTDEHHLELVAEPAGIDPRIGFKNMSGGWISRIILHADGRVELDGSDHEGNKPQFIQRRVMRALPVKEKGGAVYPLPKSHRGQPFDSDDAQEIAWAAAVYISQVFPLFESDRTKR